MFHTKKNDCNKQIYGIVTILRACVVRALPKYNMDVYNLVHKFKEIYRFSEDEDESLDIFEENTLNEYNKNVSLQNDYDLIICPFKEVDHSLPYELLFNSFRRFLNCDSKNIERWYYNGLFDLTEISVDRYGKIVTLLEYSELYLKDFKAEFVNSLSNRKDIQINIYEQNVDIIRTLCAINSAKKNKKLKERELANYKIAKLPLPDDITNSLSEFQFG
uniref:Uncharacterized protein n=1 Tax=viral metagenome TaxID=1070528 RepID=A0A6C0L344_9ZZZZ|tara:strand:- start:543 stop:1196 length:654 start_codon:yes stop_codon:yes gene_type:complete